MRDLALSAALWALGTGLVSAQTGKLEGKVRDAAGTPIQGAEVIIVGTALSAVTSVHGYYFINQVPPGTVAMRVVCIGYGRIEVQAIKILGGQTITQDVQLQATPVQLEDLTVTAAGNPLVPRDEVTTKQRIDGEFTQNLPVDQVGQVLQLQPGVVASPGGTTLSIRGGRADEAAVLTLTACRCSRETAAAAFGRPERIPRPSDPLGGVVPAPLGARSVRRTPAASMCQTPGSRWPAMALRKHR